LVYFGVNFVESLNFAKTIVVANVMMNMRKPPRVEVWKNGCGANVGKHVITFTGLTKAEIPTAPKDTEGVYITLKYPIRHLPNLFWIKDHRHSSLRAVIKTAKQVLGSRSLVHK
jgi:hypothetical protein